MLKASETHGGGSGFVSEVQQGVSKQEAEGSTQDSCGLQVHVPVLCING